MKYIFHCDDKIIFSTPHHLPHIYFPFHCFPHTWFIKWLWKLMRTWQLLRVERKFRREIFLFLALHINFPSHSSLWSQKKNFLSLSMALRIVESMRSVGSGNLDHISPLLLLFINTFASSALALLRDKDFSERFPSELWEFQNLYAFWEYSISWAANSFFADFHRIELEIELTCSLKFLFYNFSSPAG